VDQAGGFEFFDVVGQRGGRDGESGEGIGATERTLSFGDLLEELKTRRVGEGFEDCGLARSRECFSGFDGP
jgi:hypothetical protein